MCCGGLSVALQHRTRGPRVAAGPIPAAFEDPAACNGNSHNFLGLMNSALPSAGLWSINPVRSQRAGFGGHNDAVRQETEKQWSLHPPGHSLFKCVAVFVASACQRSAGVIDNACCSAFARVYVHPAQCWSCLVADDLRIPLPQMLVQDLCFCF